MAKFILTYFSSIFLFCFTNVVVADDLAAAENSASKTNGSKGTKSEQFTFQISEEVRSAIMPLIGSIRDAKVSRATVKMLSNSLLSGQVVESRQATFQIAAKNPSKFTVYVKEPEQRTRVYCDGKSMVAAMSPDAFFRLPKPISIQQAVTSLSVPLGPYPEPVLALSLAGCDPSISLIGGMKSIDLVDRKPFRSKIPSVHLRGIQADSVTWDLWITDDKDDPQPLRMLVDLTPMLSASDQVHVPEGFSYQVRYDFLTWRVTGDVDDNLFRFKASKDATEYESLEDYFSKIAGSTGYHPLLGRPAPQFTTQTIGEKKFDLKSLAGNVVVIDFWASWCKPCLAAMPVLKEVTQQYAKKGVVLLSINTGEDLQTVKKYLKESGTKLNVLMDEEGRIADGYLAEAIPQTVVIGKDGLVESVHLGFTGKEALRERLKDELEVLVIGGRIGSAKSGSKMAASPKATSPKATNSKRGKSADRRTDPRRKTRTRAK